MSTSCFGVVSIFCPQQLEPLAVPVMDTLSTRYIPALENRRGTGITERTSRGEAG